MIKLKRRPATPNDEKFVHSAQHAAYSEVITKQFGGWDEERAKKHWEEKWIPEKFQIMLLNDQPVGYVVVEDSPDQIELVEVVVLPEFQNRGIGKAMVEEEINRAKASGLCVKLQVLKKNRAIGLYNKLGFQKCGETETHILMIRR